MTALVACGGERTTTSTPSVTAGPEPAVACAALRPEPTNPVLGALPRRAVPLVGQDMHSGAFDLAALRGKVVLVSFSSSWDALTKQERPTFDALAQALGDDLAIVRIVSEQDRDERQPGDITGTARVTAPAKDVSLVLDTVVP